MKRYLPVIALSFLVLILIVTPASATVRKTGSQGDYFPMSNFKLEIDGVIQAGFKEISGLESETEVIEYKDDNNTTISKRPGRTTYPNIVLKRGFINDPALLEWYKKVTEGVTERKSGAVIVLDRAGQESIRYNFFGAWPSRLEGPIIDGKGHPQMIEGLELVVEKIEIGAVSRESDDYFPLTFHFAEGDVPALIDVASINVLFYPRGYDIAIPDDQAEKKATPWKHHDIQGLDSPTLEFTSGEPYRLEMDLFFDRYEEGKSVREYTDKIEKLALVNQELHRPPTTRAGSGCVVTLGSKTYTCEVKKTETRFTLFLDDGTPVKAIMHIVFKEFSTVVDQGKNDGPHKLSEPAKSAVFASIALPPNDPGIEPSGQFLSEEQARRLELANQAAKNCNANTDDLARADINNDGLIDEVDTKLLEESLKNLNLIDIDEDGMVDSRDVSALESLIDARAGTNLNESLERVDINSDGVIDQKDVEFLESVLKSFVDINGDGVIDVCTDTDNDAIIDGIDNCPSVPNPDQSDLDTDDLGDACDICPSDPDNDIDHDSICGDVDNCPLENPQGLDADSDGCTDTIEGLYDNLQSTEIQAGIKNSLLAKVNSALSSFTTGRVNTAINQLNAFINQVKAQSGKKISKENANLLVSFAQNVIQVNTVQLACVQPPSGIIGWWSGDANTLDLINGNNAVLHDDTNFAAGKVGNAFNLDGIGDYAGIPYSSDLDPGEITVEFWVSGPQMNQQPGNTGGIGVTLLENSIANHEGWSIFVTDPAAYTGGIGVIIGNGTQWHPIISTVGLYYPASGWRHVAMTYDGTYMQLYLNAVPQFGSGPGKPISNAQISTGRDINIGASWNNGNFARFFKGLIDEVEIYDRALSVSEIQSIFNAGSAGKCKPNVCVAAPSELVGWWTLDDAAGSSVAVDRANGNDGIVNGATLGVSGKVSTAADFDGVDDYIEVPDNADLNITDAITIDAWVKLDSLPASGAKWIVSRGTDNVGGTPNVVAGYSLRINSQGQLLFHYRGVNGGGYSIPSTGALSTGAWHHIAATLDSTADVANIYIDGQLDNQWASYALFPMNPSSNPLFIGSLGTTSGLNTDGKIDELEIFDRALSPFEIWAIYNAGTAGKCKTLTPVPWPGDPVE